MFEDKRSSAGLEVSRHLNRVPKDGKQAGNSEIKMAAKDLQLVPMQGQTHQKTAAFAGL